MLLFNASVGEIFAVEDSNEEKSYGIQMFNKYISTLSEARAQLILSDTELVETMQKDSYWLPIIDDSNSILRESSSQLPLPGYGSGTYFSYNGKACTCHDDCDAIIPSGYSDVGKCYIIERNSSNIITSVTNGNCKMYNSSIQCKGFADYVYKVYCGEDISSRTSVTLSDSYNSIPSSSTGAALMQELLSSLPVGSNIRVHVRGKSYNHSFIISAKSSTGVTIYDANRVGNCKVGNQTKTWSELASMYDKVVSAWRGL